MPMDASTIITAPPHLTFAELDGEALVLNTTTNAYHGLNETGLFILQQAETPVSFEKLVAQLADEFGVGAEEIADDIEQFIRHMEARELLTVEIPTAKQAH